MKTWQKYFLSVLSGLLMVLAFPPNELYILGFLMFLPLMYVMEKTGKKNFWAFYLSMMVYQVGTNWWIAAIQEGKDPWLIASGVALGIGHPFFLMLPLLFLRLLRNKLFAENPNRIVWLFPIVWTGFEWLHSQTDFSYPWLSIGNTQIFNTAWVQMADLGGVWLVGLVIGYCNVFIYRYLQSFRGNEILGAKRLRHLIPLAVLIILPVVYGMNRLDYYDNERMQQGEALDIALIQPNINPWLKWDGLSPHKQVNMHFEITDSLLNEGEDIDLAIWSESVITQIGMEFHSEHDFTYVRRHAENRGYSLMAGFADVHIYEDGEDIPAIAKYSDGLGKYYDTYNAAFLIDPDDPQIERENPQIYHKMRLTPFAERFPHAETFWFMRDLVKWGVGISGWQKGRNQKNLIYRDSVHIAPIICIESIYPDFVSDFALKGANIFTIITNDAWYDFTIGPEQHYQIARMRAIENRRYIARVANTGVSGLIGPDGADLERVTQYKKSGKVVSVPIMEGYTLYTLWGGYIGWLCLSISTLFILFAIFKRIMKR